MAAFSDSAFFTDAFSVNAFDFGTTPPPAPTPPTIFGTAVWLAPLRFEDLPQHRLIKVKQVIEEAAEEQLKHLELDETQRLEHLERELELENIEYRASYLEALNLYREKRINEQIAEIFRNRRLEDEAILLILIAAYFT